MQSNLPHGHSQAMPTSQDAQALLCMFFIVWTCIIPDILSTFSAKVLSKILTGTHDCIEGDDISMNRAAIHDIEKLQGIFPTTAFETVDTFYCDGPNWDPLVACANGEIMYWIWPSEADLN